MMGLLKEGNQRARNPRKTWSALTEEYLLRIKEEYIGLLTIWGAVLFGLKGAVVKSHGSSKSDSVYHAMKQIDTIVSSGVINDLVAHFEIKQRRVKI